MKKPSLAEMFEYSPDRIQLVGFPNSYVLRSLSSTLDDSPLIYNPNRENPIPSFPSEHLENRQAFFQGLPEHSAGSVFNYRFPQRKDAGRSTDDFMEFCKDTYGRIEELRSELKGFRHLPEARGVSKRLRGFDKRLESTLKALKDIDDTTTFAIDTETGVMVPIDRMPAQTEDTYHSNQGRSSEAIQDIAYDAGVKMKKAVLKMAEEAGIKFKDRIKSFVGDEFTFNPREENLRSYFERLALPVKLYSKYTNLLANCEDGYYESEWEEGEKYRHTLQEVEPTTQPTFGQIYDVRGLCPPNMFSRWGIEDEFVPIDFKTRRGEKKFILAGLHSGGKSFFLENLVLTSVIGQMPLPMFGVNVKLPKYNNIFYYRNVENGGHGTGKAEKELQDVSKMIDSAGKGDLLVFDEFLDSADASIATWLGPQLLNRLMDSDSTVFLSTHRSHNYTELQRKGWSVMSPGHKIKGKKVVPTHRIQRGIPDWRINRKYMQQRAGEILS